ncbi:hypothetical protein [Lacticaseibacillus kribbianus]|uniref:hypothetical protein n=1 Tax=Lacticaseibacillus kribbianus TaxID=2926292 RepID=UPI001CD731BC|nr:hypothetical protein [Lacticaseibacillus kribbianus]
MITVVFIVFALLQLGLGYYLLAHRRANFLNLAEVPAALGRELTGFAVGFGASALVSLVAAFVSTTVLQLIALVLAAVIAGLLGLRVPKYLR